MDVLHPERASAASAAEADAWTISSSIRAHTGYSVVSQPNRSSSVASPRVDHW